MPTLSLNGEIDELIRGRKTLHGDEETDAKPFVEESLCLRELKQHGSSRRGGAALDLDLEWCRLAETVVLGAIVVTDDSKSKKKCTQEETGDRVFDKKWVEGRKWPSQVFIETWNTSRSAATKEAKL